MDDHFARLVALFCRETSHSVGPNYFRVRQLEFDLLRMLEPATHEHSFAIFALKTTSCQGQPETHPNK